MHMGAMCKQLTSGDVLNSKNIIYKIINLIVLIATVTIFVLSYKNIKQLFANVTLDKVAILIVASILVLGLKMLRLYLAFYGENIRFVDMFRTYCKVTPVSMIIPFKLGEFFRMYCYGVEIGKKLKSVVVILLDRFFDTLALVVTLAVVVVAKKTKVPFLLYYLIMFIAVFIVIYVVFPKMYNLWKDYILGEKATKRKLKILKGLSLVKYVYDEVAAVAKGRGVILFIISLAAWFMEIGSIVLVADTSKDGVGNTVSQYLTSALNGKQTVELKQFVIVGVIMLIVAYVITKAYQMIKKGK